jgi:hypothetical protein
MSRWNEKLTASYLAVNEREYARFLQTLPALRQIEEQKEQMLREVERVIDKSQDDLSRKLLEL